MEKQNNHTKWLSGAIILIQLFDIIIHVATDQVEPIRIASNMIIIAWITRMTIGSLKTNLRNISFAAIGIYLLLNLIFLIQNGLTNPDQDDALRMMLFLLVGVTLSLSTWSTVRI